MINDCMFFEEVKSKNPIHIGRCFNLSVVRESRADRKKGLFLSSEIYCKECKHKKVTKYKE